MPLIELVKRETSFKPNLFQILLTNLNSNLKGFSMPKVPTCYRFSGLHNLKNLNVNLLTV